MPERLQGILWILFLMFMDSTQITLVRFMDGTISAYTVVFLMHLIAGILLLPFLLARGWAVLKTRHIKFYVLRATGEVAGFCLWYQAISRMEVSDARALMMISPLLMMTAASLILRESSRWYHWTAFFMGAVGVMIILRPDEDIIDPAAFLAIGAACCFAMNGVIIKWLSRTESTRQILFYMYLLVPLFAAPMGLMHLDVEAISGGFWLIPALGVTMALMQFSVTKAFSKAPLTVLLPFFFTGLIFVSIMGYLVFGQIPKVTTFLGAALILSSALYVAWREARRAKTLNTES